MNIAVEELTLLQQDAVPDDAEAIIINGPTADFSADDAAKISTYLSGGGKALITTAYNKTADTPNFDSVLAAYDISVTSGMVMDSDNHIITSIRSICCRMSRVRHRLQK